MAQIFDPYLGRTVEDGALGTGTPSYADSMGLALDPAVQPQATAAPQTTEAPRTATGGGYSWSGFDPAAAEARRAFSDRAIAGLEGQDAAEVGAIVDDARAANEGASAYRMAGQDAVNDATAGVTEASAAGYGAIGDEQAQMAVDAANEEKQFTAEIDQRLAQWQQVATQTAAMRVDPDRLIRTTSTGERMGLAASAFADVFLQPRGIKVGAIDNIQKRIQQDIDSQVTDIEQGKFATSQFRSFYEAARTGAADARDVRERLNNMTLSALENKVKEKIGAAQSKLDQANGYKLLTEIQAVKLESDAKITQYAMEATQARRMAAQELKVKWAGIAAERRAQDWRESPMNPANMPKIEQQAPPAQLFSPLINPESGQAEPIAVFRPELANDTTVRQVQEEAGEVAGMISEGRALRDRIQSFAGRVYAGPMGQRARSEAAQNLYTEYMQYFNKYRKFMTGAAGTNTEDKRYEQAIPLSTLMGASPSESVHAFNHQVGMAINAADMKFSSYHDPRYGQYRGFAPDWKKESNQYEKSAPQRDAEYEVEQKRVKSLRAVRPAEGVSTNWSDYARDKNWVSPGVEGPRDTMEMEYSPSRMPDWAAAMDERADRALKGSEVALQYLQNNAKDEDIHPNRRAYAQYLLNRYPELWGGEPAMGHGYMPIDEAVINADLGR